MNPRIWSVVVDTPPEGRPWIEGRRCGYVRECVAEPGRFVVLVLPPTADEPIEPGHLLAEHVRPIIEVALRESIPGAEDLTVRFVEVDPPGSGPLAEDAF